MVLPLFFICCAFSVMADGNFSWNTNKAELSFACDTAPSISCPSTYYGCPGSSIDPSETGYAAAQAGDADCPNPVLTYTDIVMSTGPCAGEIFIKRIWTADYPNNSNPWLLSDCTQLIVIEDKQNPTVACPNSITVANSCNTVSWPDAGAGDNCGIASLTSSIASGSFFNVGTTAVTYTALDNCGQTATCTFNVTVQADCCGAPSIAGPANYNGCIADSTDPSVTGQATATGSSPSCQTPTLSYSDSTSGAGTCAMNLTRTWTATDPASGATSSYVQQINLRDNAAPSITNCPGNINLPEGASFAMWQDPTATDDCGIASFVSSHPSGSSFAEGTTTVTYTATDHCGNIATCSFTVTVPQSCNSAPVINCPADYVGCLAAPVIRSATGIATASNNGGDACGDPLITYSDVTISEGPCKGEFVLQRTWSATEQNSNLTSTCTQSITIKDDVKPTIINCPANITVPANTYTATWNLPTANDDCGIDAFSSTHNSGQTFPVGTTTVSYTAVDQCGNEASCNFTVTVSETCQAAPVITCPADYVACIGTATDPATTGQATATVNGNNCGTPAITYTDQITNGPCAGQVEIKRTWTATEPNSNLAVTCVQTIILRDIVAPTITNCPVNITLPNNTYIATWNLPAANDNCGVASFTSSHNSGDVFSAGTTTVTYTATDNCGNATTCTFNVIVTETCTTPPTITCPGDYIGCPSTATHPTVTGMAIGANSGNLCSMPQISYSDDTLSVGPCAGQLAIRREWIATGSGTGLTATCFQNITLDDNQGPSITNCPTNITVTNNSQVSWVLPTATDNCGLASFTSNYNSGGNFSAGTTTVTYTATDNCGKTATCSFDVTVNQTCQTAPVINCPADYFGCIGSSTDPTSTGQASATATGAQCTTPALTYSDQHVANTGCNGAAVTIDRTWTATEPNSGLTATCIQRIVLSDSQNPVISNCPANISIPDTNPIATWNLPSATDDCGIASFISTHNSGDVFPAGTTTVTYTAIDNCGNTTTCSFTVSVTHTCTNVPTLNCPANVTICPGSSTAPGVTGQASATAANACGTPVVTYTDSTLPNSDCNGAGVITRTWKATDSVNGLSSTCTQIITVKDDIKPSISGCPADISIPVGGNNTPTWSSATATDNCGLKSLTSSHNSGDVFPCGVTTVIYTATDNCGLVASCSFTVTVACQQVCNTVPVITCPANFSACPGTSISPSVTGVATASNTGANCSTPAVTYTDVILQTFACTGGQEIERTWKATDPTNANLMASCIQIITLNDTSGPVLSACPSDITSADPIVTWTPPTISSSCGGYTLVSSHNSGDAFPIGTTTVTYSVTDACNNTISCDFDVTIIDNQGAGSSFTNCPNDIVVDCNGTSSNVTWDVPEFTSACSSACSDTISGYLYMGEYNGHKYFCSVDPATWPEASANAQAIGGHLAFIEDADENAFLANILTIQSAFIGCSDGVVEGDFIWTDGTPVNYTNWYPGQPNNYQDYQDYCELLSNGQWNDQYNHVKLEYIVELSCSSVRQTAGPAPGSAFGPGSTTIEYTATDGCGNSAVCSFDVVVGGGLSLQCIADQHVVCPSSAGVQVTWATPIATTCCNDCSSATPSPINGFIYMGTRGNSHYYCSNDPALWNDAQTISMTNGGHLAIINSAAENAYLAGLLAIESAYIGLSDSGTEGTFQWVDGSSLGYNNWYPGQPNDYQQNQDYVELLANGQWNDQYNNKPLEFIMEVPACLNIVQTDGPANGSVLPVGVTTVTYQATDACGNTAECTFDITVVKATDSNATSCDASADDSSKAWIRKVKFGPLYNASGNNGGYARFQGCNSYYKGSAHSLSLTPGYASSAYSVSWSVYADWNQDGDFSDNGEYIATGAGTQSLSGTIHIPTTAVSGETKLRVIMKKGSHAENACSRFAQGEVEDYCIKIVNSSSAYGNFSSGRDGQSISFSSDETITLDQADKSGGDGNSDQSIDDQTSQRFGDTKTEVRIYPNPATDIVYIESQDYTSASIYDARGRLIRQISIDAINQSQTVDVRSYESGVYQVRFSKENGEFKNERFVVHQR